MNENIESWMKQIHLDLKDLKRDTNTIKRALYGDPDNLVTGLIHRIMDVEIRTRKLETIKNKFLWMSAGVLSAIKILELLIFR